MIKQECIGIPDMILLLMIFLFQKIKIKAEIVLSPSICVYLSQDIFFNILFLLQFMVTKTCFWKTLGNFFWV